MNDIRPIDIVILVFIIIFILLVIGWLIYKKVSYGSISDECGGKAERLVRAYHRRYHQGQRRKDGRGQGPGQGLGRRKKTNRRQAGPGSRQDDHPAGKDAS